MRSMILAAAALAFAAGSASAADGPTMAQCQAGYKSDYSKMWTEAQFKTACDSMMKK